MNYIPKAPPKVYFHHLMLFILYFINISISNNNNKNQSHYHLESVRPANHIKSQQSQTKILTEFPDVAATPIRAHARTYYFMESIGSSV